MSSGASGKLRTREEQRHLRVARWGPFPHENGVFGGGIGGYHRYNSQALRSWLADEVEFLPIPMTVPRFRQPLLFAAHLPVRFVIDVLVISWVLAVRRPDVLHITAQYRRSITREAYAVALAKFLGVGTFYDIRAGVFEPYFRSAGVGYRRLAGWVVRTADAVAIQGRETVAFMRETFGREVAWLPNCFLTDDLRDYPAAALRQPSAHEPLRLAFLGYLLPAKGVDVLLEAAYRLSRERPVSLTLIGHPSPGIRAQLEEAVARQDDAFTLIAPGRVPLDDALRLLAKQHLFVFVSRFFGEGHPNAVNEALAMGLPVVASRQGFLADVVTPEVGRIVRDPEDVDELVGLLRELASDWPALQAMGRSARDRVRSVFSDEVVLRTTLALYEQAAANRVG